MDNNHVKYMKRCYELAVSAGKKGYDTFGAALVHNGEILEEAENTADYARRIFGHAEFNLSGGAMRRIWRVTLGLFQRLRGISPVEKRSR